MQNGVLESSNDRNVSGMGEASQDENNASDPVPDIPLPLQGMQRSRGRTFSLVDAFSDRRSLINRCGAACSHSDHETDDTSQQQSSVDKHDVTSSPGMGSQQRNSDNTGTSEDTRFPSIELMLGQVSLANVLGEDAKMESESKETKTASMNRSAHQQRKDASSDAACQSAGKASRPPKLFTQNCEVTLSSHIQHKYEFDLWLEVAKQLRQNSLRTSPSADKDSPSLSSDSRLPAIFCVKFRDATGKVLLRTPFTMILTGRKITLGTRCYAHM